MKHIETSRVLCVTLVLLGFCLLSACSTGSKSPDVTDSIQKALKQAGLKDVSVSQDREKGVVTLKGSVAADGDKAQAETLAKSLAAGQVVGNEIAVLPPGAVGETKTVNADLDAAIKKNLDAALIVQHLQDQVKYEVNNGVVTLTGSVNSEALRAQAEKVAGGVLNVQQVVNKLDLKNQKATSAH